jgi:hypothetical protein
MLQHPTTNFAFSSYNPQKLIGGGQPPSTFIRSSYSYHPIVYVNRFFEYEKWGALWSDFPYTIDPLFPEVDIGGSTTELLSLKT